MSEQTQTEIVATAALRLELKTWEKEFALVNNGRKPSRLDIKNDTTIAAKYKAFHRLSSSNVEANESKPSPRKAVRKSSQTDHAPTEEEPVLGSSTPVKRSSIPAYHNIQDVEPTPAHIKCALGPTPQKDGQVLGLFDSLGAGTPSAQRFLQPTDMATPSSLKLQVHAEKLSRTPQTASKRFYLDMLAGTTPKRKRAEDDHGTPSTAKRQSLTPNFLQKSWHNDERSSQRTKPFKARKGLVRSLSSMIADMRKQENDEADEEWEIMNELEHEHEQESGVREVIKDSQAVEMALGPDELPASDESDDPTAPERKSWKKKGLKRQTKRVKMKPVLHAPQKASLAPGEDSDHDDEDHEDIDTIAESQLQASNSDEQNKENRPIQKAVRKVSELAHANFRKLKIKNKNSKASGRRAVHKFTIKMLEARLEQANLLKKVVDAIKDLVQDCNFDCNDSGIALQAMDNSHVALVSMVLKSESFSPYRCDRNLALGINLTALTKVLRCAQNDDILTLKAEDAPDVVNLTFESAENDRVSEYDIKLMDIDSEHLGIPETEYAATISMPSAEFQRICRDLQALSESVSIECGKDSVKFSCNGDIGSGSVSLRQQSNVEDESKNVSIQLTEPVALTFSLKYLVNFCKATGLSGSVKLSLSNEVPLLVEYGLSNNSHLRFYLAPKIGDEE